MARVIIRRMKLGNVDSLIFDLDGTLVDSAPLILNVLNGMRETLGKNALGVSLYQRLISYGVKELVARSLDIDINNADAYVGEFRRKYYSLPPPIDSLYPGVLETMFSLAKRGFKLGICSNKPEHLCQKIVAETGLGEIIAVVVGGDTLSTSKPSREPIDYVIKKLGGQHESTVLIGDSLIDQHGSKAANIPFIFYRNGYDDGVDQSKALCIIDQIPQLLDIDLFKFLKTQVAVN